MLARALSSAADNRGKSRHTSHAAHTPQAIGTGLGGDILLENRVVSMTQLHSSAHQGRHLRRQSITSQRQRACPRCLYRFVTNHLLWKFKGRSARRPDLITSCVQHDHPGKALQLPLLILLEPPFQPCGGPTVSRIRGYSLGLGSERGGGGEKFAEEGW